MRLDLKGIFTLLLFITAAMLISCSDESVSPVTTGNIAGQILDAATGAGLAGVSITTTPATVAITTDSTGIYRIVNLAEGKYTIAASKTGYLKGIVNVEVSANDTTRAIIQLSRNESSNRAPNVPTQPIPANNATGQSVGLVLRWTASDPDPGDTLNFDVYLYPADQEARLIAGDTNADSVQVDGLSYSTRYYWQVIARDQDGAVTNGTVWSFTTESIPDNPLVFASAAEGTYQIYSATGDTLDSHVIRLTNDPSRNWYPRISPDRQRIAFVSDRQVEPQIFTMKRDGSGLFRVTNVPVAGYNNFGIGFCWSPDGSRLLYANYENLYRIDGDGTNLTKIAAAPAGRNFREVDWTSVGNKIVALAIGSNFYDAEIYLMDSNGANLTLLVDNQAGATTSPSFSPDGKSIIYSHDKSGYQSGAGRQLDAHVYVMNLDSSKAMDVSVDKPAGTNDTEPRFTADGSRIIFSNAPNDGSKPKSVWIMDLDGKNREKLVSDGAMPDWH